MVSPKQLLAGKWDVLSFIFIPIFCLYIWMLQSKFNGVFLKIVSPSSPGNRHTFDHDYWEWWVYVCVAYVYIHARVIFPENLPQDPIVCSRNYAIPILNWAIFSLVHSRRVSLLPVLICQPSLPSLQLRFPLTSFFLFLATWPAVPELCVWPAVITHCTCPN